MVLGLQVQLNANLGLYRHIFLVFMFSLGFDVEYDTADVEELCN